MAAETQPSESPPLPPPPPLPLEPPHSPAQRIDSDDDEEQLITDAAPAPHRVADKVEFKLADAGASSEDEMPHAEIEAVAAQVHARRVTVLTEPSSLFDEDDDDEFKNMRVAKDAVHAPKAGGGARASGPASQSDSQSEASGDASEPSSHRPPSPPSISQSYRSESVAFIHKRFRVKKFNKIGFPAERFIVIDSRARALRFLQRDNAVRSEFPFNTILSIDRVGAGADSGSRAAGAALGDGAAAAASSKRPDHREVVINFKANRAYRLEFESNSEVDEFLTLSRTMLAQNALFESHKRSSTQSLSQASLRLRGESAGQLLFESGTVLPSEMMQNLPIEDYLDYHVLKKSPWGTKQARIIAINTEGRKLLLLDEKRKFKKEIDIGDVVQIDIPDSDPKKNTFEAVVAFATDQRPFNLFFADQFDRVHFCERIMGLNPNVNLAGDGDVSQATEEVERFAVIKLTRVGGKKRIIYLDTKERIIRSLDTNKAAKDLDIDINLARIEPSLSDKRLLTLCFANRANWRFIFSDGAARHRFIYKLRTIADAPSSGPLAVLRREDAKAPQPVDQITLFVGTWNISKSAQKNTDNLREFIRPHAFDMYVVGLQECAKHELWAREILLQVNEGAKDPSAENLPYPLVYMEGMWDLLLLIFIRKEKRHLISNVLAHRVATGVGNLVGNKGAVGISFMLEQCHLCFIMCHMAARAERVLDRRENYKKIVQEMQLGRKGFDILHQFDHVVWFGDLNYRIDRDYDEVVSFVEKKYWDALQQGDQLLQEMAKKKVFLGFSEGALNFIPTYRWQADENKWSNKRNQPPSWTDRILFRSLPGLERDLQLSSYHNAPDVLGSDHRPLSATFNLRFRSHAFLGAQRESKHVELIIVSASAVWSDLGDAPPPSASLRYYCDVSEHEVTTPVAHPTQSGRLEWTQPVRITPFIHDLAILAQLHIMVSFLNQHDLTSLGFAILPLSVIVNSFPQPFEFAVDVERAGVAAGKFTGRAIINVVPKKKASVFVAPTNDTDD